MRHSVGIIGLLSLVIGILIYTQGLGNPFWAGMAVRVGALLVVIWLAYDQVMALRSKVPSLLIGMGLVCMLIIAARPNQGRFVVGLIVLAVVASLVLRWLSKLTGSKER